MKIEEERKAFEAHNHFQFLMPFVEWDGDTYIFKESNSLLDTQRYYSDYLHFIDCWSYWIASATRQGYKLVPLEPTEDMVMSAYNDYGDYVGDGLPCDIYKAMITAFDDH